MWIGLRLPASSRTNAPKSVSFETVPFTREVAAIFARRRFPRVFQKIAVREADLVRFGIDPFDLHANFLAYFEHFAGMLDAVPTDLADVQQAIDAAHIDKRAEIAQAADGAFANLAWGQLGQHFFFRLGLLALEHRAAAEHQLAAIGIDFLSQGKRASARRIPPAARRDREQSGSSE